MRLLFTVFFLANVVAALVSLVILPPEVAVHFGLDGHANGWASRETNALLFLGLSAILFVSLLLGPYLTVKTPRKLLNLPNKDYWLSEENKPALVRMLARLISEFGAVTFAFLLFTQVLVIQANLSDPVRIHDKALLVVLALYLAYTAWWCIRFYRGLRLPSPGETFPEPKT